MKIVECPRDAMQSLERIIPTEEKITYLNQLLQLGFDTLDFGSFVSPKAVPQLADTAEVLAGLDLSHTDTKLLAIVANRRGAEAACSHSAIDYLGYPFSISETFQLRNTRKTIAESLSLVQEMLQLCEAAGKELVVYLSMAFGNPYGEEWSPQLAEKWTAELAAMGVKTLALADTVGVSHPENIRALFGTLVPRFPEIEFGAHFHSTPTTQEEKLAAAWQVGCRRFDVAMLGFGGCPFAEDELVGNISTEALLSYCKKNDISSEIHESLLATTATLASRMFR
ncbi:MAG: hydroxymethylglutaryl-CoA lyase [Bacteroidota bacterium]